MVSELKVLQKWVGLKNTFFLFAEWYSWFSCLRIRHTYELQGSDGGPKCDKWLESHEILY
jgi:hypothetical protein